MVMAVGVLNIKKQGKLEGPANIWGSLYSTVTEWIFFCFKVDEPITKGEAYKGREGGYNLNFMVYWVEFDGFVITLRWN